MSAFGGKADIVRRRDHTFESSLQICEWSCVPGWANEFWGPSQASYGPFKTFQSRTNFVSNSEGGFLFLHFPFKNLTQNQECYWPNSDPKSQPLCMSLLQSRSQSRIANTCQHWPYHFHLRPDVPDQPCERDRNES